MLALRDISDMQRLVGRAVYGTAGGRDLRSLANCAAVLPRLRQLLEGFKSMELRAIRDLKELFPGAYGILEPPADSPALSPDQIDLAVIPCVTCSREGRRLGRGGGYYDRFLAHYRGAAVLLCRERLLRQEIPFGVHDYPIPWVLTEAGLFEDGTPSRLE